MRLIIFQFDIRAWSDVSHENRRTRPLQLLRQTQTSLHWHVGALDYDADRQGRGETGHAEGCFSVAFAFLFVCTTSWRSDFAAAGRLYSAASTQTNHSITVVNWFVKYCFDVMVGHSWSISQIVLATLPFFMSALLARSFVVVVLDCLLNIFFEKRKQMNGARKYTCLKGESFIGGQFLRLFSRFSV